MLWYLWFNFIRFMNNILNKAIKIMFFISLCGLLMIWTILYPLLRYRYIVKKRKNKRGYDIYPSYFLFVGYQRIHNYFDNFIF